MTKPRHSPARIEDKELLELLGKARSGVINMHNARSGYHMMSKAVIQTIDELAFLLTGGRPTSASRRTRRLRTIGRERNRPQPAVGRAADAQFISIVPACARPRLLPLPDQQFSEARCQTGWSPPRRRRG